MGVGSEASLPSTLPSPPLATASRAAEGSPLPGPRSTRRGPTRSAPVTPHREAPRDPEELLDRLQRLMEGEGKSPWTVKQYLFTARHFLAFVRCPLLEVAPEDLERWREHLVLSRHYSKASVYGSLRAVSYLLRAFGSRGAEGVEVPRRASKLPNFLTEDEAHALLASAVDDARDCALLHVLGYGGLRVGEVCRLSVEDLDLDQGLLRVRAGKGDKDRMVVVEASTCNALRTWLAVRSERSVGDTRVFPMCRESVQRMVRERAREAGIAKKVTPHTLRHTLATTLLKKGLDLRFIQKQLGHASVATTQIYTHVDTGALQEAYQRSKPTY